MWKLHFKYLSAPTFQFRREARKLGWHRPSVWCQQQRCWPQEGGRIWVTSPKTSSNLSSFTARKIKRICRWDRQIHLLTRTLCYACDSWLVHNRCCKNIKGSSLVSSMILFFVLVDGTGVDPQVTWGTSFVDSPVVQRHWSAEYSSIRSLHIIQDCRIPRWAIPLWYIRNSWEGRPHLVRPDSK